MQLKIIVQLHLIHESSNITCLFHQGSSTRYLKIDIYIYIYIYIHTHTHTRHGCERWSVGGNFTMDRTGYRDVDLAFGTGTRQCNKRRHESSHQFNYSDFKPVYNVLTCMYALMHANHEG
jgi:hypothetical protein